MLRDKELKVVQKEVNQIEAEWSMAQKDVVRSKLSLSNSGADKLAKEQSKNKLLSLCLEMARNSSTMHLSHHKKT